MSDLEFDEEMNPSRRRVIQAGVASLAMAGLASEFGGRAAFAQKQGSRVLTPQETEGPYWVEEKLKRSDIRVDPKDKSVQKGLPLALEIRINHLKNGIIQPLKGAYVDLWHCNAAGLYSDVEMNDTLGRKFLRGYQVTDDKGVVKFTTVYPGWYHGRAVHIHARVRTVSGSKTTHDFVTQFFFDENVSTHVFKQAAYRRNDRQDTTNVTDNIFSERTDRASGGVPKGKLLMLKLKDDSQHASGSIDLLLNLASLPAHSRGGGPGGPGGPPPGGFGGPPPDDDFGGPDGPPPGGPPPGGRPPRRP